MQYAPTLTDQKFDSPISIEPKTRYTLGRMQYAPTLTDQKLDFLLSIESPARYVSVKYVFVESYTRQKLDSPLKPPTRNDSFFVYPCRGVLHTPHKCPWQWANDSSARYVSIKYVLIESYTRQKLDSPLKPPTPNDPFFVYRCRGVCHTPHKRPRQGTNESICHPFFEYT